MEARLVAAGTDACGMSQCWQGALRELVRQVYVHCAERGELLDRVRAWYEGELGRLRAVERKAEKEKKAPRGAAAGGASGGADGEDDATELLRELLERLGADERAILLRQLMKGIAIGGRPHQARPL